MKNLIPWTWVLAVALGSCAKTGKVEQDKQVNPIGVTGAPLIRSKNQDSGTPVASGGNVNPVEKAQSSSIFTPTEDIVYTDPDNPDAAIPELSDLLTAPKRGPWEESETIAKQRSAREGKPLLIWFTDSVRSPMCKAVSQELFSTNDFGSWATEKLVRLRVDASNLKTKDLEADLGDAEDYRARVMAYNAELKKRYKIMGYPSLIMLNSSGEVVGRYRGYKRGDAQFLWGQLKHAEAVSSQANKAWRAGLEKKGYREWQDRKGRKVFAKLTSYSKGSLSFIEPDGTRSRTQENNLSDEDRSWIADQKKLRKIQ
ncbi:MAG: thioredoxin fold domain-containing protein [Verrucomicrobiota bacterium]